MREATYALIAVVTMLSFVGLVAPAAAGTDIPWTWNSNDHDSQARFESTGDYYYAEEYAGSNYVDWQGSPTGSGRWWIPGAADGVKREFDVNFTEGSTAWLKVCQDKTAWVDDCSPWKSGVA